MPLLDVDAVLATDATLRDLAQLRNACARLPALKAQLAALDAPLLQALAVKANYYGFMAADELGLGYNICPGQADISADALQRVAGLDGFRRALELRKAGLDNWAVSEWGLATGRLPVSELRIAGALAFREGWYDRAIVTLANSGDLNLYEWRFPLPWQTDVTHAARQNQDRARNQPHSPRRHGAVPRAQPPPPVQPTANAYDPYRYLPRSRLSTAMCRQAPRCAPGASAGPQPGAIEQVVGNLLSNAARHTGAGSVIAARTFNGVAAMTMLRMSERRSIDSADSPIRHSSRRTWPAGTPSRPSPRSGALGSRASSRPRSLPRVRAGA